MSNAKIKKPPRVAEALLKLLFPDEKVYCTIGDLHETHRSLMLEYGSLYAWGWYWLQLIQAIPAYFKNTAYWGVTMVKSYLKIAFRSLARNRLTSSLNVLGLSVAIGCCTVIFSIFDFQYMIDDFHLNRDRIYLIESLINREGEEEIWGSSPLPLGPALKSDLRQVKEFVRVSDRTEAVMRFGDTVFNESIRFAESSFFEVFSFPILWGDKNALRSTDAVIISEEIARKYFRDENPVGKKITLNLPSNNEKRYYVQAVFAKLPKASSLRFEVLLAFEEQFNLDVKKHDDWSQQTNTFVMLDKKNDVAALEGSMGKYLALQNAANGYWKCNNFIFEPLPKMSLNSWNVRDSIAIGTCIHARVIFTLMGLFMIALACLNYINMAIASAEKRLKEIGVRKVIGGRKVQVVGQFMTEHLLICSFAAVTGLIWAKLIFIPGFNSIQDISSFKLSMNLATDIKVWAFMIALVLFTGICAGTYPSFYVASFRPIHLFRGKEKSGGKSLLAKTLLTVQFALSFIATFFAVAVLLNDKYQRSIDWGYNKNQIIFFQVDSDDEYTILKNELSKNVDILAITGGVNHVGHSSSIKLSKIGRKEYEVNFFHVASNYLDVMDIKQNTRSVLNKKVTANINNSIIVNETFVKNANLDKPLQQRIEIGGTNYTITGVLRDFHYKNFWHEIKPVAFALTKGGDFRYLVAKVAAGKVVATADYAESTWNRLFPNKPYTAFFQDDIFGEFFRTTDSAIKYTVSVAIILTLLSCMGLFGLGAINITRRSKELCVRKILGANLLHVTKLLNREFVWLLVAASVVAAPISYFFVSRLFNTASKYNMEWTSLPFIITSIALFLPAILTISSQVNRIVSVSPVDNLRTD